MLLTRMIAEKALEAILIAGIVMALIGTIIIFSTVTKKDDMRVIPYEAN